MEHGNANPGKEGEMELIKRTGKQILLSDLIP
jgi:hypothetical protein